MNREKFLFAFMRFVNAIEALLLQFSLLWRQSFFYYALFIFVVVELNVPVYFSAGVSASTEALSGIPDAVQAVSAEIDSLPTSPEAAFTVALSLEQAGRRVDLPKSLSSKDAETLLVGDGAYIDYGVGIARSYTRSAILADIPVTAPVVAEEEYRGVSANGGKMSRDAELLYLIDAALEYYLPDASVVDKSVIRYVLMGINSVESGGNLGDTSLLSTFMNVNVNENASHCVGPFQIEYASRSAWLVDTSSFYATPKIPDWGSGIEGQWNSETLFVRPSPLFAPDWVYGMVKKISSTDLGWSLYRSYLEDLHLRYPSQLNAAQLNEFRYVVCLTNIYHGSGSGNTRDTLAKALTYFTFDALLQLGSFRSIAEVQSHSEGNVRNAFQGDVVADTLSINGLKLSASLTSHIRENTVLSEADASFWYDVLSNFRAEKRKLALNFTYGISAVAIGKWRVSEAIGG